MLGGGGDNEPCLSFLWSNTKVSKLVLQEQNVNLARGCGFLTCGLRGCGTTPTSPWLRRVMLTSPPSTGRSSTHPHTDYHC